MEFAGPSIGLVNHDQKEDRIAGHKEARQLPDHELHQMAIVQKPRCRHRADEFFGFHERSINPGVACFFPHGSNTDFHQSCVLMTLACWMAAAGSTCLGHTRLHSPMKVHSQMPSLEATISARSDLAPSLESRL